MAPLAARKMLVVDGEGANLCATGDACAGGHSEPGEQHRMSDSNGIICERTCHNCRV